MHLKILEISCFSNFRTSMNYELFPEKKVGAVDKIQAFAPGGTSSCYYTFDS